MNDFLFTISILTEDLLDIKGMKGIIDFEVVGIDIHTSLISLSYHDVVLVHNELDHSENIVRQIQKIVRLGIEKLNDLDLNNIVRSTKRFQGKFNWNKNK